MRQLVNWLVADVTQLDMPPHSIDVWHDRAVFHFLTEEADRQRYVQVLMKTVKPGGFVIIATFAENGQEQCSGLPVHRYCASGLHSEFGAQFQLLGHEKEIHHTPFNTSQHIVYCYWWLEH